MTGAVEADVGTLAGNSQVLDVAMSQDGRLVAYIVDSTQAPQTDANNGAFILIDPSADSTVTALGNTGLQTFTTEQTAAGPPPTFAIQRRRRIMAQVGDGSGFHALLSTTMVVRAAKLRRPTYVSLE